MWGARVLAANARVESAARPWGVKPSMIPGTARDFALAITIAVIPTTTWSMETSLQLIAGNAPTSIRNS
jgi:hypothetical protein